MLKLYPDHVPARARRLTTDVLAAAWVAVWAAAGYLAYQTVMDLQVISDGLSNTGHALNSWAGAFKSAAPRGIPILSQLLQNGATAFQQVSGDPLLSAGAQARVGIDHLALAAALLTALPPILIVGGAYLLWRLADAREMGAALAFVSAAESTGRLGEAKAVLAYRAVSRLSFRRLMRASKDPIGDLAARRYDALAAEMLREAGLESFRLFDAGLPELEAPPASPGVGEQRQHQHEHSAQA